MTGKPGSNATRGWTLRLAAGTRELGNSSDETVNLLRAVASDPESGDIRRYAVRALGQTGNSSEETRTVLRAIANDPDSETPLAWAAADALSVLRALTPPHR